VRATRPTSDSGTESRPRRRECCSTRALPDGVEQDFRHFQSAISTTTISAQAVGEFSWNAVPTPAAMPADVPRGCVIVPATQAGLRLRWGLSHSAWWAARHSGPKG
jgi:hypothetical protein